MEKKPIRFPLRLAMTLLSFVLGVAMVRLASPPQVVVTWETASEVGSAGFHLYRSDSPDGPFVPITENPIPAQGDPLAGASYSYQDSQVSWGQRYFYQLEEVERSGTRNRYQDTVEGRAGMGWPWALAGGALMTAVVVLISRPGAAPLRRRREESTEVVVR